MENDRHDSLPEFDTSYIDRLLSADQPSVKKETPRQPAVAEEPQPAQSEETTPANPSAPQKRIRLLLLLGSALICLLVGFLLGRLTAPKPDSGTTTSTEPVTTAPVQTRPDIAVDYAAMSTKQLTDIAIQIPELKVFGNPTVSMQLTPAIYEELKTENPVLAELEQRPDAVEQLTFYNLASSSLYGNPAATALIEYYVGHLGFDRYPFELAPECEWLVQDGDLFTVYEYTEAPSVYFMMDEGGSEVTTVFNFGGCEYYLRGEPDLHADNANFWYRMELTAEGLGNGFASVPDPTPELTWFSPSSSAWVTWQKSDQGWFIYGYTPSTADLTFTVYPSGNARTVQLTVLPVPEDGEDPAVFAQCVLDQAMTLQVLSYINPDKDLATYPIVEAVLAQPGGISALLNLAQTEEANAALDPVFSVNVLVPLLTMPTFSDRMTTNEALALQLLRGDSNVYLDLYDLLNPTVMETSEGIILKERPDLWVGAKPESLSGIPVSEMDYWVYVPLAKAAMILQQPDWELAVIVAPGADGTLGVWPAYDNGRLVGWVVSGKLPEPCDLSLHLCQKDTTLCVSAFRADLIST